MSELHHTLQGLHEELQRAQQLDPADRAMLETVMGDIQRLLQAPPQGGSAGRHGESLEGAAVKLEAGHPGVASAIRAVLDALGKAGI